MMWVVELEHLATGDVVCRQGGLTWRAARAEAARLRRSPAQASYAVRVYRSTGAPLALTPTRVGARGMWTVELEHLTGGVVCRRGGLTWKEARAEAARLRHWPERPEAYAVRVYRDELVPVYREVVGRGNPALPAAHGEA